MKEVWNIAVEKLTSGSTANLGYKGEENRRCLKINVATWLTEYPNAAVDIVFKRPDGTTYNVGAKVTDGVLEWDISEVDLAVDGSGEAQLLLTSDGVIGKSVIFRTYTQGALTGGAQPAPATPDWVPGVIQAADTTTTKAAEAVSAADRAESYSSHPPIQNVDTGKWQEWNGTVYVDTELPWQGSKGDKGDIGNSIEYTWNGTQLGVRVHGDTDYVYVDLKGAKGDTGNGITSISRTSGTGAAGTTDTYTITFTSGGTATFTVYNGSDAVDSTARASISELTNNIKTPYGNKYVYPTNYVADYYMSTNGSIYAATGWGIAKIPCLPNTVYTIWCASGVYSGDRGAIGFYNNTSLLSYIYQASSCISGAYHGSNCITVTTPANCNFICITVKRPVAVIYDDSATLICCQGKIINDLLISGIATGANGANVISSILPYKDKSWWIFGDSLSERNGTATRFYHDYVADELGFTVTNKGVSGTGYKKNEGLGTAFYQRILTVQSDADLVTIFGSGNDLLLIASLGTETDTTTDTICGCINKTIDNLYSVLPTVRLGIITPTPWKAHYPSITDGDMTQYCAKIVNICKLRGIPCLDLYHTSGLRPWDATYRTLMYSRDGDNGTHPDENGHKLIASYIREFIKTII